MHDVHNGESARPRRAVFMVNPKARQGDSCVAAVRGVLERGGIEIDAAPLESAENLSDMIRRRAGTCDLVVIGGGDGTLNSAAKGLFDTGVPLGVIPLGTANDFARTLGIPADPVAAARLIVGGTPRLVDLGEVNGHPFLNVASIGFSADLARELSGAAKKKWGKLGYAITAARILLQSRLFTAYIEHDGTIETVRTLQASVGNGRHYGGGMTVAQDATADDGTLDFYSLEVDHWWKLLLLAPSLREGTQSRWNEVRAFRTTEVVIRTRRPRAVNTDGELTTWTPAHFTIRPAAIRVYAPATPPGRAFASSRRFSPRTS
ncbi:lipid kinase [Aquabacter spiritensis]|uniref:YegS/Rv2252/BmrU family lipid kinase n=1 Tax=Aquabacter spiritensis TaxID=933073 RepID=A0A4R3M063_9HYPH|nr:lipid kinase [Aquabacter spiritensis]TCT05549.1 YegS/Rv2252/BmrU family lipid kinase [Aquabacter spiritensis]